MTLTDAQIRELQARYRDLTNYREDAEPDAGVDPLTYVDSNGDTLLHIAAQRGDLRTVELLLQAGIDVNQPGDMGNTALHDAQTAELAQLLLDHGASSDLPNEFGQKPRSWKKP